MGRAGKEMKKKKGLRIIPGDFNFVMGTKWDKIGGTQTNREQREEKSGRWTSAYGTDGGTSTQTPSLQRGLAERLRR